MALPAAAAAPLLVRLLSLCLAPLAGAGAGADGRFQLWQPAAAAVSVGQALTLRCEVSADAPAGPVKWLKLSGGGNQTVYDQKGRFPRVRRAANGSNTDFTIRISDARPEDAGTYYCVKLQAGSGEQVYQRGPGTTVSVHESAPFAGVAVPAAVLAVLLLVAFVTLCVYRRTRGGGSASSPSPGGPDPEASAAPEQRHGAADADLHYAVLQPLPAAPRRAPGPGASEYASIRGAAR
ncbi:tyrosine-protein phosphatase non-receptor type substrate 1-like [Rhea pennata]|uniref:tyrosine-protein phosphatase non-receptor type substrate 1-like n=1 Tax=Rhea pennata TaxID=8795 RepID=UPI002E263085